MYLKGEHANLLISEPLQLVSLVHQEIHLLPLPSFPLPPPSPPSLPSSHLWHCLLQFLLNPEEKNISNLAMYKMIGRLQLKEFAPPPIQNIHLKTILIL